MSEKKLITEADLGYHYDQSVGGIVQSPKPGWVKQDLADGFAAGVAPRGTVANGKGNGHGNNGSSLAGIDKSALHELDTLRQRIQSLSALIANIDREIAYYGVKRASIENQPDYGSQLDALLGAVSTKETRLRKLGDLTQQRIVEQSAAEESLEQCQRRFDELAGRAQRQAHKFIEQRLTVVRKALESINSENDAIDTVYWSLRDAGVLLSEQCPVIDKARPSGILDAGKRTIRAGQPTSVDLWVSRVKALGYQV